MTDYTNFKFVGLSQENTIRAYSRKKEGNERVGER
jgi:hypothetical protein